VGDSVEGSTGGACGTTGTVSKDGDAGEGMAACGSFLLSGTRFSTIGGEGTTFCFVVTGLTEVGASVMVGIGDGVMLFHMVAIPTAVANAKSAKGFANKLDGSDFFLATLQLGD
jgi:hypothetical protein